METSERLLHFLERFFSLEQHQSDPVFLERLRRVQAFQMERLKHTHKHILDAPAIAPAFHFLLDEVYRGEDLQPVATDIQRALNKAMRLLPAGLMETCANVMEAATLTQELDEALTRTLFDQLEQQCSETDYLAGFRNLGCEQERLKQFQLIGSIGHQIDRYVRSRTIQTTFRLVRRPAHAAGFAHLYAFLEKAFRVMKPVKDTGLLLEEIAAEELAVLRRIQEQHPDPFTHGQTH